MSPETLDERCAKGVAGFDPKTQQYTCGGCGKVLERSPADHVAAAVKRIEARKRAAGKTRP